MSIQPLSNPSPVVEPATSRRRAAERDAGAERESFVLPQEEAAPEAAAPVRERARETGRDTGETRRAADESATAAEKPSDTAAKPANEQAAAEASTTDTAKPTGKPVATVATPVTPPATPAPDIGALVSIAVAAQAEGQPAQPGKPAEAAGEKLDAQKAESEPGAAAAEPKAEGAAPVVVPMIQPIAVVPPGPVPTLPVEPAAHAAEAAAEGDLLSGKAGTAAAAAALSLMAAREALSAAASETAASAQETAGAVPAPAPKHGRSVPASEMLALPVDEQVATPEAGPVGNDKAAQMMAQAQSQAPAQPAGQASVPADLKPIEALQQALNPIDLSALGQQGNARPEPLRILTMPEQTAAQTAFATPAQTTAGGPPTPLHVLPIEIGLRALAGARQFDIRLDPGELGRVDVNLSISDSGEVSAKMVVDRVETLHLLQRDARTLERAFEQAGLKPSDGGVDITLRDPSDQSGFRQNRQQDEAPQRARVLANGSETTDDKPIITQPAPVRRFVRLGGVDLSV